MSELILRELRGDDDASDELKAPRVAVESHAKLMEKYSSSLMPHDDNTRTKEDDPAGSSWLAERHRELV